MVAGSWSGNTRRDEKGGTPPASIPHARTALVSLVWWRTRVWPHFLALYLLAAATLLLPWPFGAHPAWPYNWEGYTAWRWQTYWEPPAGPALEIWAPIDGLMTDSGQGPLVGLPVAVGVALAGLDVTAMRVPVALLAALSVPVLYLVGRRVVGPGPAALAALLLATSPVFLLYGRTATLVGISLLPLLLSALLLVRLLDAGPEDGWQWRREGALAASLLLGIYAYAPVRLLWPLAIGALCLAAWRDRARRGVLLRAALLSLLAVPLAVMALERTVVPESDPVAAAVGYFHARGEQLVAMRGDPGAVVQYLREGDPDEAARWEAVRQLVSQNAADLMRLLLDRGTAPILTDYWNANGRLWPWFILPFTVAGAGLALWKGFRGGRFSVVPLLPLLLCLGLTLPLLLTSRVHVGRLLPALPFALLLAAAGAWAVAGWLSGVARHIGMRPVAHWIAPGFALALLVPVTTLARTEMTTPLGLPRESLVAATLADWRENARERGSAVLVEDPALGDEIERVHAATYRLELEDHYRFVDLQALGEGPEPSADPRPTLLWRGVLSALQAGEMAQPCGRLWFVAPEIAAEFFATWRAAGCSGAPDSVILP